MTLLTILLALGLERYLSLGKYLARFAWLNNYIEWVYKTSKNSGLWRGWYAVASVILPLIIVVGVVYYLLVSWLGAIAALILGTLILLYCFGPLELWLQAKAVVQQTSPASKDDPSVAPPVSNEADTTNLVENVIAKPELPALEKLWWQTNECLFGVLFWFIVLGPIGAVLYRSVTLITKLMELKTEQYADVVSYFAQLQGILDWVPVRVTALCYLLLGNFSANFGYWLDYIFTSWQANRALLLACAYKAHNLVEGTEPKVEDMRAVLQAIDRVLLIYLSVVAVFTIAMWL